MADNKDYYGLLGVSKTATQDEIKKAYRNMAKTYHPDKFASASESERKNAEQKFKEINHAYEVLSDDQKRDAYDRYGSEDGPQGGFGSGFSGFSGSGFSGGFGGFDDIFNIFSGFSGRGGSRANMSQDGDDIIVTLTIDFKEAAFGCERDVNFNRIENCPDCKGTGAKDGTAYKMCTKCGGKGYTTVVQNTFLGQTQKTVVCDKCRGTGKEIINSCSSCGGKGIMKKSRTHHVSIPAGVDNGQRLSYAHEGHAGKNGGETGNLIVNISVRPHEYFKRDGYDLYIDYPVTMTQAACGATIKVPTLNGKEDFNIPEGTQYGTVFKLKGKGIKYLFKENRGDLYVTVLVEVPSGMSKKQKGLLSDFESSLSSDQYTKCRKFKKTVN